PSTPRSKSHKQELASTEVNNKRRSGSRPDASRRSPDRRIIVGVYLFLTAITLAVFGQTIRYDFVNFDDDLYVYNSPAIKAGLTLKGITFAVISAVFFFLMLGAYVRYARSTSIRRYLLVTVLFAAGLMAKSMLVTAPVVLIFLDYWPLNKIRGQQAGVGRPLLGLVIEKIPLFVLSAAACVITFVLQKRATGAIPPLPLLWRLENALASYVIYIWKTLWPTGLAVFYPHPNNTLPIGQVIFAVALLVAVTAAVIIFRSQRPHLLTAWFWYVVMLFPAIGVIQVGEQGHADRYTYLPSIGLFLAAVWFTADIAKVRGSRSRLVVATA